MGGWGKLMLKVVNNHNSGVCSKVYDHGGKSKGTTCVVDRDVTAYMVVDRVLRFPTE